MYNVISIIFNHDFNCQHVLPSRIVMKIWWEKYVENMQFIRRSKYECHGQNNCEKRNAKKDFRIYYLKLRKSFILIYFRNMRK